MWPEQAVAALGADDLHSIKRIALVRSEFLDEGLPAALHVNGQSEADFKRWTDFLVARPEVTDVAYEFITGASTPTLPSPTRGG